MPQAMPRSVTTEDAFERARADAAMVTAGQRGANVGAEKDVLSPLMAFLEMQPDHGFSGKEFEAKLVYKSLLDLLPQTGYPAVQSTDGRLPLTHHRLKSFVEEFDLRQYGIMPGMRVGISLPNGPELSLCMISVAAHACAAPVNPESTTAELVADLGRVKACALIIPENAESNLTEAGRQLGVPVFKLRPSDAECGLFSLKHFAGRAKLRMTAGAASASKTALNLPKDHALVLCTSGTSGKKKIVPFSLSTVVVGAACIVKSFGLTPFDCDLNMMPLFHIGGIARALFAPVLSGGSVVSTSGFDPSLFWDVCGPLGVTWYYASPTMHHMILEEGQKRGGGGTGSGQLPRNRIRMIANSASTLLPSLAAQMRQSFRATVLPAYGMTECMPISTPPTTYELERPGTVGVAMGPEIAIFDANGKRVEGREVGTVVLRGAPLFEGYEDNPEATKKSFFADGWFNTGDKGWMDEEGFLYLTGRSKEVINRGGEMISPFEVEESLLQHPRVGSVLCFAAPHAMLEETVGVWVVPKYPNARPDLAELQRFAAQTPVKKLHPSKWPQVLVFSTDFPRGGGVGKPQRIQLGSRLGLDDVDEKVEPLGRTFDAECPPKGVPITTSIAYTPVEIDFPAVGAALSRVAGANAVCMPVFSPRTRQDVIVGFVGAEPPNDEAEGAASERLLNELASSLHTYALPAAVVFLPGGLLPDAAVLAALPLPAYIGRSYVAPRTSKEAKLCSVWASAFGVERVGIHDDFYELGGHSLLAMQLARDTGYTPAQIMASSCVSSLALISPQEKHALQHTSSSRTTDAERRLVYLQLKDPHSIAYNMTFERTFDEGVDVRRNLELAVAATPVLSVCFAEEGDVVLGPRPCIADGVGVDATTAFDLERGPVARFGVVGQRLTACVHHAVFDARSVVTFLRRVEDPGGTPRDAHTIRDYAEWETSHHVDEEYWRAAVPESPRFVAPATMGAKAWSATLRVAISTVARIQSVCASRGATPFAYVLCALHRVLRVYASQARWALGVAFDARPLELMQTCGMFVNTVLMGFEAEEEESVEGVHERWVGEVLPRARDAYHEVVRVIGGECNIMLACNLGIGFYDALSVQQQSNDEGRTAEGGSGVEMGAMFDLSLGFEDGAHGGWSVDIKSGIGEWPRVAERLENALRGLAASEGDMPTPQLLAGEEADLLKSGMGEVATLPAVCVHELIETQAKRTPKAVALVHRDEEMVYGEMWRRSTASRFANICTFRRQCFVPF